MVSSVSYSADIGSYGRWCGPFNTGTSRNNPAPIDKLDEACMEHDLDIKHYGYHRCQADGRLMHVALMFDDSTVASSLPHGERGIYAESLFTSFQIKPCQCERKVCYPCVCRTIV